MGATETVTTTDFLLSIPITKIDREQRLVSGIATAEVIDKNGDVVDYETAKLFFSNEDLWPGNMREMHQPKAVGKAVAVAFDDEKKTISLTSRVSKGAPDTWEKILDGTLSMYSIGGGGERKAEMFNDRPVNRIFLKSLAEVSYVDNGACPVAKFDVVKSATAEEPIEKKADGTKYAGTDGKSFPISEPQDVADAAKALGRTDQDRGEVKSNIIAIAYEMGEEYVAKLPNKWRKKDDQKEDVAKMIFFGNIRKMGPEPWDIDMALSILSAISSLASSEYWEAYGSNNPDSAEVAQVKLLNQAAKLIFDFLASEWEEQFTTPQPAADGAYPEPFDLGAAVSLFTIAADVIKAGARHSKGDRSTIQAMHDSCVSLGAECGDVKKVVETPAPAPVVEQPIVKTVETPPPAAPVQQVVESGDVKKLTDDLAVAQTTIKEQGEAIAKLTTALDDIKKLAVPGGPVRGTVPGTPVSKSIGNAANPEGEGDLVEKADALRMGLEHLANAPGTDASIRQAAAVALTKMVHAGSGVRTFEIK